ncbi:MAG: HAD-IB family phosphatase [Deferribacterales bacterium]|nr:HAD-IB family phosphatase [Deferribacterales bacterium]
MNVYDFDGTIYDGDCSIDFLFYAAKKQPKILLSVPTQLIGFIFYGFKKINKTQLKEKYFSFLKRIKNVDDLIDEFWEENNKKIKQWYLNQQKDDDVIISASPQFLVEPVCKSIGIECVIASDVDKFTGKFNTPNCHDKMKVTYFFQMFPDGVINNFYSDSLSDLPMAQIAEKAFLVNRNSMHEWLL